MSTYSDLLKDPRWQKKRLKVLERDEFCCRSCGDGENTLHVHHCYYKKGNAPWEYQLESLVTLCKECHKDESAMFYEEKNLLSEVLSSKGLLGSHLNELSHAFLNLKISTCDDYSVSAISWFLSQNGALPFMQKLYKESL